MTERVVIIDILERNAENSVYKTSPALHRYSLDDIWDSMDLVDDVQVVLQNSVDFWRLMRGR